MKLEQQLLVTETAPGARTIPSTIARMTIARALVALGVGVADYHGGFTTKRATALATVATALVAAAP